MSKTKKSSRLILLLLAVISLLAVIGWMTKLYLASRPAEPVILLLPPETKILVNEVEFANPPAENSPYSNCSLNLPPGNYRIKLLEKNGNIQTLLFTRKPGDETEIYQLSDSKLQKLRQLK
jgi:hypothetical protein